MPILRLLLAAAALAVTTAPASAFCLCLKCVSPEWQSLQAASGAMKPAIKDAACLLVQHGGATQRGQIIAFRHPTRPDTTLIFRLIGMPGDTVQMIDGQVILNGAALPHSPAPSYMQFMRPQVALGTEPRCLAPASSNEPCLIDRLVETLPDGTAYDILDIGKDKPLDTAGPFTVPPGHVFVLGDNRDNAADSRIGPDRGGPGMIPMTNILGPVVEITNP